MSQDSAEVRHILIAYKTAERADPSVRRKKWEAKKLADSLCAVIQSGKTPMTALVLPFTDDSGSKSGKLGDYGMFTRNSGFVTPYKNAGFNNPVGAVVVVETEFGFHVGGGEKSGARMYLSCTAGEIHRLERGAFAGAGQSRPEFWRSRFPGRQ
jgi:hypothetical protein